MKTTPGHRCCIEMRRQKQACGVFAAPRRRRSDFHAWNAEKVRFGRKPRPATSSWLSWVASLRTFQPQTCFGTFQFDQLYRRTSVCRYKTDGKRCKCRRGSRGECCEFQRYCRNRKSLGLSDTSGEYRLSLFGLSLICYLLGRWRVHHLPRTNCVS